MLRPPLDAGYDPSGIGSRSDAFTAGPAIEPGALRRRAGVGRPIQNHFANRAGGVDLVTSHVVREVIEHGPDSMERDLSRK